MDFCFPDRFSRQQGWEGADESQLPAKSSLSLLVYISLPLQGWEL